MIKIHRVLFVLLCLFLCSCSLNDENSTINSDSLNTDNTTNSSEVKQEEIKNEYNNEIIELAYENDINDSLIVDENEKESIEDSKLIIHFIDVGQGDSALIISNDKTLLIDGGPPSASSLLFTYLKNLDISHLDYVICSHPDDDHVGGISGALNYASVSNVYSPYSKDTRAYDSFVKYTSKYDVQIQTPSVGDSFKLAEANVEILACNIGSDNDASIVTKITFKNNTFLFMGDASTEVEDYLINNNIDIKCDVLKVGHHGSKYSTSHQFLYLSNPKYAVISAGEGNSYGHPTEEVLSKLRDADVKTYRTDMQGDIICYSDGYNISFETEKNSDADTYKEVGLNSIQKNEALDNTNDSKASDIEQTEYKYCINKNTKKFHYSSCSSVKDMKESNKKYTNDDRDTIISMGYEPCKRCNP